MANNSVCPKCANEIVTEHGACAHCGRRAEKDDRRAMMGFWLISALFMLAVMGGLMYLLPYLGP